MGHTSERLSHAAPYLWALEPSPDFVRTLESIVAAELRDINAQVTIAWDGVGSPLALESATKGGATGRYTVLGAVGPGILRTISVGLTVAPHLLEACLRNGDVSDRAEALLDRLLPAHVRYRLRFSTAEASTPGAIKGPGPGPYERAVCGSMILGVARVFCERAPSIVVTGEAIEREP